MGALCACETKERDETRSQRTRPSDWIDEGFVELTPALRAPTTPAKTDRIHVFIALPTGGVLRTEMTDLGPTVVVPVGTRLDRVEAESGPNGELVADVRGTDFEDAGERFHVFRRNPRGPGLVGTEWDRGSTDGQAAADHWLAELVGPRAAHRLVQLNQCTDCHRPNLPPAHAPTSGRPNRATDGRGSFAILAALTSETAVETYRPVDPNREDPHVSYRCASGALELRRDSARCSDNSVPLAKLDVAAALAEGDEHAGAVCETRRFLFDHLDDFGRRAFSDAFTECAGFGRLSP